jgi:hypothetical protein
MPRFFQVRTGSPPDESTPCSPYKTLARGSDKPSKRVCSSSWPHPLDNFQSQPITREAHVRYRRHDASVFLYAFDLIELNGDDLRRDPLEVRKATLASVVEAAPGIRFNEHMEGDGSAVFAHVCKLGLEGIVSKRKDSAYRSGRSPDWLKMKNSAAPAVRREEEEEWGKKKRR